VAAGPSTTPTDGAAGHRASSTFRGHPSTDSSGLAALSGAPFTFVTDGVASAVAHAKAAGNGNVAVGIAGPNIAQQCLNLGLLDEVRIDLVPVLLGKGIRYFDNIDTTAFDLHREQVVEGDGVTHIRYNANYH
jgi:dihydrofolate reductase